MEVSNLLQCSGAEFFDLFEKYSKIKIPVSLKKVLILSSYDQAASLSGFDEKSVEEIEYFVRNVLNKDMIITPDTIESYLGIFSAAKEKYMIMSGEKRLLEKVAQICTSLYRDKKAIPNESIYVHCDNAGQSSETACSSDSFANNTEGTGTTVDQNGLFNLIGSQIITVFNDAKRTSLSAFSWPSREIASQISQNYKSTGRTDVDNVNLLYLTPSHHEELLDSIVASDVEHFRSVLREAYAVSLRVDGSTDKTPNHNIYVMVHVVTANAELKTYFLGFGVPDSGNAADYFKTTTSIVSNVLPWEELFPLITSLVTDGESLNSGRIQGLWQTIKAERLKSNHANVPLIIVWCCAHRINLAWKSTAANELIQSVIRDGRKLSKYFRRSGQRTHDLRTIATRKKLKKPLKYPKYFEIRWSEFTHSLFYVILRNWRASIAYFRFRKIDSMLNCWLLQDRLHLLCFLVDLLTILKSFQKICESDTVSIVEISEKFTTTLDRFTEIQNTPLEDGWEMLYLNELESGDLDEPILFDEELLTNVDGDDCTFAEDNRIQITQSLITFLNQRMNGDEDICNKLRPLLHIRSDTTLESLTICHHCIIPEYDFTSFVSEYYQAANLLKEFEFKSVYQNLKKLLTITSHRFVLLPRALARASSIKPHSADVERLINIYNKFKDDDRSSLSPQTLFNFLYVKTNMSTLEEFDPAMAARHWFAKKQRKPRLGEKAKTQQWFNGVFKDCEIRQRKARMVKF